MPMEERRATMSLFSIFVFRLALYLEALAVT
jgi:hypothetical protein